MARDLGALALGGTGGGVYIDLLGCHLSILQDDGKACKNTSEEHSQSIALSQVEGSRCSSLVVVVVARLARLGGTAETSDWDRGSACL